MGATEVECRARRMAGWWGARFVLDDKRIAFVDAVAEWIGIALVAQTKGWELYVDYDPNQPLLGVLQEIGVECRGCLCSADGIFRGRKFGMIYRDGKSFMKDGYGAGWTEFPGAVL